MTLQDEYKSVSTISHFQKLMTSSVINKNKFIFYNFTDDITETDNYWWIDTDPRYQLLKEINIASLITLNSEEGELEDVVNVCNWKGSISFLLQRKFIEIFKTFFKDYIFVMVISSSEKLIGADTHRITLVKTSNGKILSTISYQIIDGIKYTNGGYLESFEHHLNDTFVQTLHREMCEIHLVDPVKNRPVHSRDGIFTVLNKFLIILKKD